MSPDVPPVTVEMLVRLVDAAEADGSDVVTLDFTRTSSKPVNRHKPAHIYVMHQGRRRRSPPSRVDGELERLHGHSWRGTWWLADLRRWLVKLGAK